MKKLLIAHDKDVDICIYNWYQIYPFCNADKTIPDSSLSHKNHKDTTEKLYLV